MRFKLKRAVIVIVLVFSTGSWAKESKKSVQTQTKGASEDPVVVREYPDLLNQRYSAVSEVKENKTSLSLGGAITNFSRPGASLMGYTAEVSMSYSVKPNISTHFDVAQSMTMAGGGPSVLFTGLRLGGCYALWGIFSPRQERLKVNGSEVYAIQSARSSLLGIDFGIDQVLFNGVQRVVPATGISLGVKYEMDMWGMRWLANIRYGQLVLSSAPANMISTGLGMLIYF